MIIDEEELICQLALRYVFGVGDINAKQLISYAGSARQVLSMNRGKLEKIPGIGKRTIDSILQKNTFKQAESEFKAAKQRGVAVYSYMDQRYPARLKLVSDGPVVLFYKGSDVLLNTKIIGIVGTRNATSYGKRMTEMIIKDMKPHNALIVSGLAYGIDITAHRSAIVEGLPTLGVLAGGIDKIYPSVHTKTVSEMIEHGGVISEKALGVVPEAHNFPARNRIIAGLSDALIVIEAADKCSALITAEIAYTYDRDVFAVPGDVLNKYSKGCNNLIAQQKANIYTKLEDLEYLLNWDTHTRPGKERNNTIDLSKYGCDEKRILEVLLQYKKGLQLDELSWKTQIPVNTTVSFLLKLEFEGVIRSMPGKTYAIN